MENKEKKELRQKIEDFLIDTTSISERDGDFFLEDGFFDMNGLLNHIEQKIDSQRIKDLEFLLKNGHGGGNWRRLINTKLEELKKDER